MTRPPLELRLGSPYTEHDTPGLRQRIESDLAHVAQRIHDADPRLVALVLTGGFARGEGTARGELPVNDYDLVAVRSRPGGARLYRDLARSLSDEIDLEVDLMPIFRGRLPHVGPKIFWLDARLGGRVIAGDERELERIRLVRPEDVPRGEIARLLGNRAAGMLLSLPSDGEPPDEHQRDLQATKAVLAAMDATLLIRGRYAPSMRDRLALTSRHADHAAFATAVEWKLAPSHPLPPRWWEQARDVLLRAVEETGARRGRDGLVEHALHIARARRVAYSPSQAVRRAAWDLLSLSTFPAGPADLPPGATWGAVKRGFFEARARTLQ